MIPNIGTYKRTIYLTEKAKHSYTLFFGEEEKKRVQAGETRCILEHKGCDVIV